MIVKRNNAEGGVQGVGITAANSGGARSGDAFDVVATNAGHTYDTFPGRTPQGGAMNFNTVNPTGVAYSEWSITLLEFWGSCYASFYPNPIDGGGAASGQMIFIQALGAGDAQAASIGYNTVTGKVGVAGQGAPVYSTGTAPNYVTWMRIDWHFRIHASTGLAEARVYFDANKYTYETITYGGTDTLGTIAKFRIGDVGGSPPGYRFVVYDDIIIDDRNWVDRNVHPTSSMGRKLS